MRKSLLLAIVLVVLAWPVSSFADGPQFEYVIHVSVDGLRPDAVTALGATALPNFYRMRTEGAFTDNARTDVDYSNTLPNHVDQMTGTGVWGPGSNGHEWYRNGWDPGETLALNKGSYVAGVYDVAHDNGLRTGHYASKSKFGVFGESWNAVNGAPDITGVDNGRAKIDRYFNDYNTDNLMSTWVSEMTGQPQQYSFVHYNDPDSAGHGDGWDVTPGSPYSNSIVKVDGFLGEIFNLIDNNATFTGKTAVILTADHGGNGTGHGSLIQQNYTIPFYVWGSGIAAGADLYALNGSVRQDPGTGRPLWTASVQPIRNGDAPNMALELLGLGAIPGSGINAAQDLAVAIMGDADGSGYVDDDDLSLLLTSWHQNTNWANGDFTGDGYVDDDDLSILLTNWHVGTPPAAGELIPEPATMTLLAFGACLSLLRRRRR